MLERNVSGAVLLLAAVALGGLRAAPTTTNAPPLLLDGVAAEVGAERITIAETMAAARDLAERMKLPAGEQTARLRELYDRALDELVARHLILQAYRNSEQKLQSWMVDRRIETIVEEHFGGDRVRLQAQLARENLSFDRWRQRMEDEMVLSAMRHQHVDGQVSVAPADVREFYATNSAAFALPGPVRVGMILLTPRAGEDGAALAARADALHARLRAGADFAALALAESAESHARNGGDWGYVKPEEVFKAEIVAALAALPPGGISAPIVSDGGCYIVRKISERPDLRLPLDEAWPAIEAHLRRALSERRFRAWIDSLRQRTHVHTYPLP
jgi:peptidyl-prolyl cis-trans isomerase SurA